MPVIRGLCSPWSHTALPLQRRPSAASGKRGPVEGAEGVQVAIYAFKDITSPYWLNEKRFRDHHIAMIGEKISQAASQPESKFSGNAILEFRIGFGEFSRCIIVNASGSATIVSCHAATSLTRHYYRSAELFLQPHFAGSFLIAFSRSAGLKPNGPRAPLNAILPSTPMRYSRSGNPL